MRMEPLKVLCEQEISGIHDAVLQILESSSTSLGP